MFEARTAWAIVLLLAPTGVAAAGSMTGVTAPSHHTAYVEIVVDKPSTVTDLARVEARLGCMPTDPVGEAIDWLADGEECTPPPGAAVYVHRADAPDPGEAGGLVPTGTVYELEDPDRVWSVREYTYGGLEDERHHVYVLTPDISERVDDERAGQPVRGVINMTRMDVAPGQQVQLETTLGPAPTVTPTDPTVHRVSADEAPRIPSAGNPVTG